MSFKSPIPFLQDVIDSDVLDSFVSMHSDDGIMTGMLILVDKDYPDIVLCESLLHVIESVIGKEKYHDLLMSRL